jgi:hypothetical protein
VVELDCNRVEQHGETSWIQRRFSWLPRVLVFCNPADKFQTSEHAVYGERAYDRVKKEMEDLGWEIKEEFGCAVEFR